MKYILDTNIIIFFFKKKYEIEEQIDAIGINNCCISEITLAELRYGAYHSSNTEKHLKEVDDLLYYLQVISITSSIKVFGQQKSILRKKGTPIDDFDLLIGATALQNNFILVTNNTKHFARIDGLKLIDWVSQ